MPPRTKAIVAFADSDNRRDLARVLEACEVEPIAASSVREVNDLLAACPTRVMFCDEGLPGGGIDRILQTSISQTPPTRVVVCSLLGGVEEYLRAMEKGAFDFICPPYRLAEVAAIMNAARGVGLIPRSRAAERSTP